MSGIIFHGTRKPEEIVEFYTEKIGMSVWLEQKDCVVLNHGSFLLGFCQRKETENSGIITFLYNTKEEVDNIYSKLWEISLESPREVKKYGIYRFFAADPEKRTLEFQYFINPALSFREGKELLVTRRSIRKYKDMEIPRKILDEILVECKYAPSSMNSQPNYFIALGKKEALNRLSSIRGRATAPISKAPMAVAICSNPKISKRYVQDGCIAAYHFILSCWSHGLGTCWIADMDREVVKDILGINRKHYVATVTPVGFPDENPKAPERKDTNEFVINVDD